MAEETLKIYVWPDNSWESEEEIDDMDWYLQSSGKSDDYKTYEVPLGLDAEDIDELIELQALPGMLTDTLDLLEHGTIILPQNAILVVKYKGDAVPFVKEVAGKKMLITSPEVLSIEVLKGA